MLLKNNLEKIKNILNSDNVLANLEERYCYSTDAANIELNSPIPDLVVFVESIQDVQKVVEYANTHKIPIIPRGAGTNMVGSCICNKGGIVLNFSKMNKILDINPINMTARVQPGVILGELKSKVEELNLFYPPDPSNYKVSTIGGSIAQSSSGALSFKYGTTKDYVLSLKVVTADGKLLTLGSQTHKNALGYHLNQLIVGSEGTLGIVVEATLKLIPKPEATETLAFYFDKIEHLLNLTYKIKANNIFPAAIEFLDQNSLVTIEEYAHINLDINSKYLLLIQLDGNRASIKNDISLIETLISSSHCSNYELGNNKERATELWNARRVSYAATTRLAPDVISDDIVVPNDKIQLLIEKCEAIIQKYNLKMCMVGHIGDGNLHPQIALDLNNENEFRNYNDAKAELYKSVVDLGGSISAEHGVGITKLKCFQEIVDESTISYMKMIKNIFDPNNILNPGKIFE